MIHHDYSSSVAILNINRCKSMKTKSTHLLSRVISHCRRDFAKLIDLRAIQIVTISKKSSAAHTRRVAVPLAHSLAAALAEMSTVIQPRRRRAFVAQLPNNDRVDSFISSQSKVEPLILLGCE